MASNRRRTTPVWLWGTLGSFLLVLGFVGIGGVFAARAYVELGGVVWAIVIVFLGSTLIALGASCINYARKLMAVNGQETLPRNTRRVVLYLRCFSDDDRTATLPDLALVEPFIVATKE